MPVTPKKSCLIITYGPVPTPQYQTVEGGGMRAWGLASGLVAHGLNVTVAVNNNFPQDIYKHEGVRLVNWDLNQHFIDLINSYDSVIISYCMGDPSVFVAKHIHENVQLILDVYVPIYVEVSARDSKDIDTEYTNYMRDMQGYNQVLLRGDYFLVASESQKIFYTGVLGALGIINPRSYREDRLLIVPFGIHDQPAVAKTNPYKKLGISDNQFIVLWFGGLYPWFRAEEFIQAIKNFADSDEVKFVIVGGKNPFNTLPDFLKQYEKVYDFALSNKLLGKTVYLVDWVNFEDRINWYKHADVVISLNQPGEENIFAWRTRVMDYVWGELPIITNGGDPLSEYLISKNAALRITDLSSSAITKIIKSLTNEPKILKELNSNILKIKPEFVWQKIIQPVKQVIVGATRPYLKERSFRKNLPLSLGSGDYSGRVGQLRGMSGAAFRYANYARRKGLRRSFRTGQRMLVTQLKSRMSRSGRRFIFISHPINNTGAPQVLLQILEDFATKYGTENIQLLAPHILAEQLRRLREEGIKVDKAAADLGNKLIFMQMGLKKDDFVLMNTAAIYDNYYRFVIKALESGRLKHAYWFIHEDIDQLPSVNPTLLQKNQRRTLHNLITKKRLTILVPSIHTKKQYDELLNVKDVRVIQLRINVPDKYKKGRSISSYDKIDFLLAGTPADGRKGQLIAIPAFYDFIKRYQEKNPQNYRQFRLHLVGLGDDYISQQVRWVGQSLLGQWAAFYSSLPYNKVMEITARCNAAICCSLNESFGLSVAEGMMMNHVVLRNNSAGLEEQLKEGVNGFLIDHTNIPAFADTIEKLLNKQKTTNEQLMAMGEQSQKMIEKLQKQSYLQQIEKKG